MNRYKVLLVGDTKVGKTTYINYLLTNKFTEEHSPTFGVEVYPYVFNTNYGPIIFEFWDCAGDYKYRGIDTGYYICSDGAIIMYTSEYNNCNELEKKVRSVCNDIPIIFCKNKSDTDINIMNKMNIYKPILLLARQLTKHEDLELI